MKLESNHGSDGVLAPALDGVDECNAEGKNHEKRNEGVTPEERNIVSG